MNSTTLSQVNIEYNQAEKQRLTEFIAEHLNNHKIITQQTVVYYDKFQESESFEKIAKIYSEPVASSKVVKDLLLNLKNSPCFEHT